MDIGNPSSNDSRKTYKNETCDSLENTNSPFLAMIYSLLFLVGLILNCFTLRFHCRGNRIQVLKSWMIYLKHLTAADFLLCASLPMRIVKFTSSSNNIFVLYCSIGAPLLFVNMSASILFMGFIAANRYMKIFYNSGTHFLMTTKASHIISISTWIFLLSIETPYSILLLSSDVPTKNLSTCNDLLTNHTKPLYYVILTINFNFFFVVLFSLLFFYCSACCRVSEIQQKQLGSPNSKKLVKSRRNMLVLVCVFCFCFVPYHVVRILYILLQGHCSKTFYYIKEVAVSLSVCNICLDPLMYVFLCKGFRAQLNLNRMLSAKDNKNTLALEKRNRGINETPSHPQISWVTNSETINNLTIHTISYKSNI
ncbi:P2Y purinoceptor 14-like [Cyprinodon tularosa]|uniref:P2Y purinoceptor 14-like n=1 Tax=Cyprinodon tularosa TaxID=77115 RepID=UPI0018E27001|nr:P2Y purinoceptor 14-like [Cyprinodon tularosa]